MFGRALNTLLNVYFSLKLFKILDKLLLIQSNKNKYKVAQRILFSEKKKKNGFEDTFKTVIYS